MTYSCCDELRKQVVADRPGWNGIDFLEVVDRAAAAEAERQRILEVHFLKKLGSLALTKEQVRITGGVRVVNIQVIDATAGTGERARILKVTVDQPGDFSIYTLRLVAGPESEDAPPGIDPRLASIDFSFKVECPSPFDCAPQPVCPVEPQPAPDIDYLAKDYASFRRVMLDRLAMLMPQWKERNPADVGIALVEALAYTADQLSYQQDAVATEAYLGTARRRISVRRHARLMDYFISEGCNARTWVQLHVSADMVGADLDHPAIPVGTRFTTQIAGEPTVMADDTRVVERASVIFEAMEPLQAFYADHNELHFYTWSDQCCCLPKGAVVATLAGHHPNLTEDTVLIIEEILGPKTGSAADADPTRRHPVRLISDGTTLTDPVTGEAITEIVWHEEDALPFPFCISATTMAGYRERVSIARGNVVLADHGVTLAEEMLGTVPEPFLFVARSTKQDRCVAANQEPVPPRFRPRLAWAPLTFAGPYDRSGAARAAMRWSLRDVRPVIELTERSDRGANAWQVRGDLLNSDPDADHFVVEIDNDGSALLRFGDDVHGRRPESGTAFTARYRTGNGRSGNIGADSLVHLVLNRPEITLVRNPLPAVGGRDPESLEDVRQRAPVAYRVQERAVAPADYAEVTERHPDVQRAAATFRWTGSWHTAFVTVDRGANAPITQEFEDTMRAHVDRYRMAGHDVEVDGPRFVPLEIHLHVCVAEGHFRRDVERELYAVFSNRDLPDGRRGFFHPDDWTFGQPVYLSAIYAAAHRVTGVESVEVQTFQRQGVPESSGLASGRLDMDRLEIARLDNDRNFAERGLLTIEVGGGK